MDNKNKTRKCGVLLHPTSFPSPYGIGDFGEEARITLKKLSEAGVKLWQILPLGPTGYGNSPYSSLSCFAGNEYMIDLRSIDGVTVPEELKDSTLCSERINYSDVYTRKFSLLKWAAAEYLKKSSEDEDFVSFCEENAWWLDDYALFRSLADKFSDTRWFMWDGPIKKRTAASVKKYEKELKDSINVYKALQFFFYTQWNSLHEYANSLGISIIGDMPIFCAGDSVDVWTNKNLFLLDAKGNQKAGAGVPPDAFSPTGQYWGNPLYNWPAHEKESYDWFKKRVEMTLKNVDILRIDHFRGFESYWEIPAGSETAESGSWKKGPGMKLLKNFSGMDIIAEDLGVMTEAVEQLLSDSGFPGMKVLQFAFDLSKGYFDTDNAFLPHNYNTNCVAYTGTHDNETTRGWYDSLSDDYKDIIRRYFQCPDSDVVWQMIRVLIQGPAKYAIFPLQDLLGLDNSARMNAPSTVGSFNWSWRFDLNALDQNSLNRLREYISLYGR
ncbi:MAG: 4-alpha-glucanotransferase [Sphaerochaetaceae bacterium]|nr:4-alpha-glucanotransferase [Sphaerochaetaceae bacterium]